MPEPLIEALPLEPAHGPGNVTATKHSLKDAQRCIHVLTDTKLSAGCETDLIDTHTDRQQRIWNARGVCGIRIEHGKLLHFGGQQHASVRRLKIVVHGELRL